MNGTNSGIYINADVGHVGGKNDTNSKYGIYLNGTVKGYNSGIYLNSTIGHIGGKDDVNSTYGIY